MAVDNSEMVEDFMSGNPSALYNSSREGGGAGNEDISIINDKKLPIMAKKKDSVKDSTTTESAK
jgi:hypothetical protein